MAKGFFTQAMTVLFDHPPDLDTLAAAIDLPSQRRPGAGTPWIAGPALQLQHGRATLLIDVIDEPWPDHMGDPEDEVELFMAWGMGHLAPQCSPGNLARASSQCWHWPDGPRILAAHKSFVRLRLSYVIDAGNDAPVIPPGVDPVEELQLLTTLATAIARCSGALAVFVPAGESAHAPEDWAEGAPGLPTQLWTNLRLFDTETGWVVMDSVGLMQLDLPDFEACFVEGSLEPEEVGGFLGSLVDYQVTSTTKIEAGHTVEGPGGSWRAQAHDDSLVEPPRRTLRLFRIDQEPPEAL